MEWLDVLKTVGGIIAGLFGTGGLVVLVKNWLGHRARVGTAAHKQEMERDAATTGIQTAHIARLETRIAALEAKLETASAERLGLHQQIAMLNLKIGKLEGENRGLRSRVAAMQADNIRLQSTMIEVDDNPSHAVIVCSEGGTIVEWSAGARAMFHYDVREVIGNSVSMLVPGRLRGAHHAGMQRAATTPLPYAQQIRETFARTKEGDEVPVKIVINSWEERGHRMFEAVIRRRETMGAADTDGGVPVPRRRRRTDHVERGEGLVGGGSDGGGGGGSDGDGQHTLEEEHQG